MVATNGMPATVMKKTSVTIIVIVSMVARTTANVSMTVIINWVVTKVGNKIIPSKKWLCRVSIMHDKEDVVEPTIEELTSMQAIFPSLFLTLL